MIRVRVKHPDIGQIVKEFRQKEVVLGRSEDCDVCFDVPGVSREHVKLVAEDQEVYLEDLQSTNGTLVCGKRIRRCPVTEADRIQIGEALVQVVYHYEKLYEEEGKQDGRVGVIVPKLVEELLGDELISEVLVNASAAVFIRRGGGQERLEQVVGVEELERLTASIEGVSLAQGEYFRRARLPQGIRVNMMLSPFSERGTSVLFSRAPGAAIPAAALVEYGTMSSEILTFLSEAIVKQRNFFIAGLPGSGRTALLESIANLFPEGDRIVCVEDFSELRLNQQSAVCLQTANMNGSAEAEISELLDAAVKFRPDCLVLGELNYRSEQAFNQIRRSKAFPLLTSFYAGDADSVKSSLAGLDPVSAKEVVIETVAKGAMGFSVGGVYEYQGRELRQVFRLEGEGEDSAWVKL